MTDELEIELEAPDRPMLPRERIPVHIFTDAKLAERDAAIEGRVRAEVADLLWNMPHASDVYGWLRKNHTCTSECDHDA